MVQRVFQSALRTLQPRRVHLARVASHSRPTRYALTDLFAHQESKGLGVGDGPGKWRYHRLAFRHLKKPLTEEEVGKLEDKLRELRDRPYETDSMEMTKVSWQHSLLNRTSDLLIAFSCLGGCRSL